MSKQVWRYQIRVDGEVVNAFYATRATALDRVHAARIAGHNAELADMVLVHLPTFV